MKLEYDLEARVGSELEKDEKLKEKKKARGYLNGAFIMI